MQADLQEMSWLDQKPSSCSMSESILHILCRLVELVREEALVVRVEVLVVKVEVVRVELVKVELHHSPHSLDNRTE